ncbi:MAG: hypothetical protein CM15mP89_3790 [Gammaproteobacteria bacterium]|nr:MAG: hypothetical protein CM15mP89_3790 [Gammaproteobacteria bacterium]
MLGYRAFTSLRCCWFPGISPSPHSFTTATPDGPKPFGHMARKLTALPPFMVLLLSWGLAPELPWEYYLSSTG